MTRRVHRPRRRPSVPQPVARPGQCLQPDVGSDGAPPSAVAAPRRRPGRWSSRPRRTSRPAHREWFHGEMDERGRGAGRRTPAGASHQRPQPASVAGTQAWPRCRSSHNGPTSAITLAERPVPLRSTSWKRGIEAAVAGVHPCARRQDVPPGAGGLRGDVGVLVKYPVRQVHQRVGFPWTLGTNLSPAPHA